jgi:dynein cytoplasmic 1 heavy chain
MTLGNVYDLDLKKNEAVIKDVIIQAQGEMALEEYLKQASNYTPEPLFCISEGS